MKTYIVLLSLIASAANAQTIVSSYYPDTGIMTRRVCSKIQQRVHYDRFDNSIIVVPSNDFSCRDEVISYSPQIIAAAPTSPIIQQNTIIQQPIKPVDKTRNEYIRDCVSYGLNKKWCEKNWDGIVDDEEDSSRKK